MKRLLLFLIPLFLCSCSNAMNRREIDEINLIHMIGIDYENNEYTLSALYTKGGGADPEKSSGGGESVVASGKGKSVYEAYEDLLLKNSKTISLAQAGYFMIGENAAKNGIEKCLDFLSRDESIKMEALIFITKGVKAADFINKGIENKKQINEDLKAITQKQMEIMKRNDNTLVNLMNDMQQSYSALLVPYIITQEDNLLIDGYAVFDQNKLYDYLDNETSTGVNFIKNIVRRYPIYLENGVGLLIDNSKTKLKAKLVNNEIYVTIKLDFETSIKEVLSKEDIFNEEMLQKLTKDQNDYMKRVLGKAVNYSIASNLDILQIARLVENKNEKRWKDIGKTWNESIRNIKYNYVVNSKIVKSFILGNER